jgi:hypothetical protein
MDTLVEGFDVLGVHVQYWMPLAVLIAAAAIAVSAWARQSSPSWRTPVWVNGAVLTVRNPLPVYPDNQTFSEAVGMSQRR